MDRFDWIEIDEAVDAARTDGPSRAELPHDGPTFYRAARRMREAGHFRPAVDFYNKSIGFQPHHFASWVEAVDTLVKAGQIEEADARSQQALDAYRQVRVLYASRALVLAHKGEYTEAERHLGVSIEGEEKPWYAKCVEAEMHLRKDIARRGRSRGCLETAADWAKSRWEPHFLGGWMFLDAQLPALAAGHFAEAAHWRPGAPILWLCLGDCFRDLRLYDQALFYYQRVTELEPAHELALKRQRKCAPRLFGLLRVLNRAALNRRWRRAYDEQRG